MCVCVYSCLFDFGMLVSARVHTHTHTQYDLEIKFRCGSGLMHMFINFLPWIYEDCFVYWESVQFEFLWSNVEVVY